MCVLVHSGFHNKTPKTAWLTQQTLLTGLEAEKSKVKGPAALCLLRNFFLVRKMAIFCVLRRGKGQGSSLGSPS